MKRGYEIYANDKYVAFIEGRNRLVRENFLRETGVHPQDDGTWGRVKAFAKGDLKIEIFEYTFTSNDGAVVIKFTPAIA